MRTWKYGNGNPKTPLSFWKANWKQPEISWRSRKRRFGSSKISILASCPRQLQSNLAILNGAQSQLQSQEDALNVAKHQNAYLQSLLNQYHSLQKYDPKLETVLRWDCRL